MQQTLEHSLQCMLENSMQDTMRNMVQGTTLRVTLQGKFQGRRRRTMVVLVENTITDGPPHEV